MRIPRALRIAVAFVVVFAAGIAAGAAGTVYKFKRAFEQGLKQEKWKDYAMADLTRKLSLTDPQQAKVRPLLDEAGNGYKAAFGHLIEEGGRVMVDFNAKLDAQLTPEQVARRREMSREFRESVKRSMNIALPES